MIENINKNISVWRGNNAPPTDYHLWETSDGKIKTKINGEWKQITSPTDKEHVDRSMYLISTSVHDQDHIVLDIEHNDGRTSYVTLHGATKEYAGLMSSDNLIQLGSSINNLILSTKTGTIDIGIQKTDQNIEVSTITIPKVSNKYDGVISPQQKNTLENSVCCISTQYITENNISYRTLKNNNEFDTIEIESASKSVAGLMSALDKINLDSLYTKLNNITLKSVTPTSSTTLKSYQLVDSNNNVLGDTINIPKDSSIKTAEIAEADATVDSNGVIVHGSGDTALSIVYILSDGTYKIVNLSLSKFLEESEFGDGLNVENHKVSIKKSDSSENYLKIYENSISVEGIDAKLNTKVDKVEGKGLSANDFTNNYKAGLENLLIYAKDLGNYDTEENALNALKDISICGNKNIVHVHLTYGDYATITMFQSIESNYCRQIIFNKSKIFQRAIYFTDSNRTQISYAEDWSFLFGDRLAWDEVNHKYVQKQFDTTFNANVTDAIPIVSQTTDGLMNKDDKIILDDLNSWNYIGILSSWNSIAKLTTESTEAEILTALTITPLRGNKINTKTELFKVLDECAINKKFLKESSTNAHVFVNHIGSCYVIYILGNKASVLNGKLVGTLVLRSITITANSNETLAILKNPLEINLEDINKKITEIENNINNLSIKAE